MKKSCFALVFLPFLALVSCSNSVSSSSGTSTVSSSASQTESSTSASSSKTGDTASYVLNADSWNYDSSGNVYYQLGLSYCSSPDVASTETMAICVPGNYFTGTKNSSGTYTCQINASGTIGSFTALTAPVVFPVNTPGYSSQKPMTSYSYNSVSSYIKAGFIYVQAGLRGKDISFGQAPYGVTDLKAAIRTYRYNLSKLPGSTSAFFTFGHSGGGAQSSIAGASGDSPLYTPYLEAIGAPEKDESGNTISDAVCGAMCWCPITSLDIADEAYEWNMGQFFSSSTRSSASWQKALSNDMSTAFASYINDLGLKNGTSVLSLSASSSGLYLSGSYYDYIISVIADSLNNYLSDTYGTSSSSKASYVSSISSYASYDASSDKASITSLANFITANKNASKPVGAFDSPSKGQTENTVMRYENAASSASHFDAYEKKLLADNYASYAAYSDYTDYRSAFETDFSAADSVGENVAYRSNMYNPMYYLDDYYEGYKTSTVAPHWRIRTGIKQTDTALTTEADLALALKANDQVKDVDFASVWNQGHTEAERTGTASANFISWVEDCLI